MKELQKKLSSGWLPETSGYTGHVLKKMTGNKKSASALISPDKRWI
jgi:hypothetical protein